MKKPRSVSVRFLFVFVSSFFLLSWSTVCRDRRDQRRIGSGRIQIDRDQGRDRERDYHRYDRDDRDRGDRDRGDRDRDLHDRDRDRNRMDRDRDRRYVAERPDRFRRGDNRDFGDRMAERVSRPL